MTNKEKPNKKRLSVFIVVLFSLFLSTTVFAAQDFIVENRTSPLFIVNGTTGNVLISPSFGLVGIGILSPNYLLQTASGTDGRSVNLSNVLYVNGSSANVGINITAPADKLHLIGQLRIDNDAGAGSAGCFRYSGTELQYSNDCSTFNSLSASSAGGWTDDGSVVRLTTGSDFVGIGTASPTEKLYVSGNASITGDLVVGGYVIYGNNEGSDADKLGWVDDGSVVRLAVSTDNVGIGTTTPQNPLEVIGAVTFAGGVNASSLNVTGFSIADDSLVTLSDGSKKKIKDIKAGDYVLSLDETTGKLVPRKVNALLDHGIKPIYEMTTEDGRAINTTAEHPYLAKLYSKEDCAQYADTVWNINQKNSLSEANFFAKVQDIDSFDGKDYCTRWVEVKHLEEGTEIAVPITEISQNYLYFADSNCITSSATSGSINPLSRILTTNAPKCPPMPSTSVKSSPSVYFLVANSLANLPKSFPISANNNPISPIVDSSKDNNYLKLSDYNDNPLRLQDRTGNVGSGTIKTIESDLNNNQNKEVKSLNLAELSPTGIQTDFTDNIEYNNYLNFSILEGRKNASDMRVSEFNELTRSHSTAQFGRAAVSKTAALTGIWVQTPLADENPGGGVPTNNNQKNKIKGSQNLEIEPIKVTLQQLSSKDEHIFKSFAEEEWCSIS